jgi:prolyl-tRNA synthetase
VVEKAELADNSCTRGCMVIRPYGYAIWDNIKNILDKEIRKLGVQNAYFPLLVPLEFLQKESEHIKGFAKETAVVTHHRLVLKDGKLLPDGKLESPYVIRPTSETIIGDSFSKWIKSHRDLPLKINQWANVMRWEMRTRLFLRTSEFLWQEGHNVFKTETEAEADARKMLEVYDWLCQNYLAIYGLKGKKTDDEKFPGAVNTYTIESMMQDGKALQSCTSHNLGQNFTKSNNIKFTSENGVEEYAWSTSWGLSTRVIGALIMSHSDDNGLVLPPAIAPYKIVIIPIIHDENKRGLVLDYCNVLKNRLGDDAHIDLSAKTSADKKWYWIRKGAPIRLEIGMKEAENNNVFYVVRNKLMSKNTVGVDEFMGSYGNILNEAQDELLERNKKRLFDNIVEISSIGEINDVFDKQNCFVSIDEKLYENVELKTIMEKLSLSYRCRPFEIGNKIVIAKNY